MTAATGDTGGRRGVVVVLTVTSTVGFVGDTQREVIVAVGILLLLVDRAVPVPRLVAGCVHAVAAASLWIYLTQWQVYPPIEEAGHPYLAVAAALAVGILAHLAHDRISTGLHRLSLHRILRGGGLANNAPCSWSGDSVGLGRRRRRRRLPWGTESARSTLPNLLGASPALSSCVGRAQVEVG